MSSIKSGNFEARLAAVLADVEIPFEGKLILEFIHERRANGIKPSTLYANASVLKDFSNFLGKGMMDAERSDLNAYINRRDSVRVYRTTGNDGKIRETRRKCVISDSTMDHRKVILRVFYRWLMDTEEYPDCVRHLKTRTARTQGPSLDRLVTRDELERLLQAASEPRLKALVSVMWESGMRSGEIVSLNTGSVAFDELGAKLTLPWKAEGLKTGTRTVRVLSNESAPYLQQYMENHPYRDEPEHCLFYGASRRNPFGRLLASSLNPVINSLAKRARIKRHIKRHDFRHTAATEKARLGYNEAHLRHYFGWSRTSDMPSTYVHLAGADFEEMMMEKHGLQPPEAKPKRVMFAPCPVCSHENPATNIYCNQCRRPLKPGAEEDATEQQNEALAATVRDMVQELLAKQLQEAQ